MKANTRASPSRISILPDGGTGREPKWERRDRKRASAERILPCFTESENLNEPFRELRQSNSTSVACLADAQVFSEFRRSLDSGWDTIVRQSHHRPEHLLTFPAGVPLPAA